MRSKNENWPTAFIKNPQLEGEAFYWRAGPVGVLLSHGFTATTAEVRLLGRYLLERGFSVAGPLLPGHNAHPDDLNHVRWQDWFEAYESMAARLLADCQTVFVGGESTGGLLALLHAIQHPETAGVLLYTPALRLKLGPFDLLRLYLASPFIAYLPKPVSNDNNPWQGYTVNPLKGVTQVLSLQRQVRSRLNLIRSPVLIVHGRLDPTVHPSVPETIARSVSSEIREVHWMENSGHVVIIDQEWRKVAEISVNFIERVLQKSVSK